MKTNHFLFTSGCESVLNESLDYGIKKIDAEIPNAWVKSLQNYCMAQIDFFSSHTGSRKEKLLLIVGKDDRGRLSMAIPCRVSSGHDHVGRENFKVEGRLFWGRMEALPAWEIVCPDKNPILQENLRAWMEEGAEGEDQKILRKAIAFLPREKAPWGNATPRLCIGLLLVAATATALSYFGTIPPSDPAHLPLEKPIEAPETPGFEEKARRAAEEMKKTLEKQISQKANDCLIWMDCFFEEDRSVLADMKGGGVPGSPEDDLRQYLEYCYFRLKAIGETSQWGKKTWREAFDQIGQGKPGRFHALSSRVKEHRLYFSKECEGAGEVILPLKEKLSKRKPEEIRLHAWVAFDKIDPVLQRMVQWIHEYKEWEKIE